MHTRKSTHGMPYVLPPTMGKGQDGDQDFQRRQRTRCIVIEIPWAYTMRNEHASIYEKQGNHREAPCTINSRYRDDSKEERRRTMHISDIPEITQLSIPEKILLAEEIWDSIASEESRISIPQSHLDELERRQNNYQSAPGNLLSLEELQAKIESRK